MISLSGNRSRAFPWLLLNADLGGPCTVTADVVSHEVSVRHDMTALSIRLNCELGSPVIRKEPFPGAMLWDAVLSWERPGRRLPSDIAALRELARRHPGEFAALRMSDLRIVSTWEDGR